VFYRYLIPVIALIGLVSNLVSIILLLRDDTMNKSTSLLLRMLALADFINILFAVYWTSLAEVALTIPWMSIDHFDPHKVDGKTACWRTNAKHACTVCEPGRVSS
jgi:Co/Zn/Cd efflux system component